MVDTSTCSLEALYSPKSTSLGNLYEIRNKFPTNILFSYININSIRNKLQDFSLLLKNKVDVLAIAETKLDESFPLNQFLIEGYTNPYRLDVNGRSGGLLVYVNENIHSRTKNDFKLNKDLQIVPVEINLRKTKWMVFSIYRPPKQCLNYFISKLSEIIDFYTRTYENILLMGDFNAEPNIPVIKPFMENHDLYNHIKTKTCRKSTSGLDLIIQKILFAEFWDCGNGIKRSSLTNIYNAQDHLYKARA